MVDYTSGRISEEDCACSRSSGRVSYEQVVDGESESVNYSG